MAVEIDKDTVKLYIGGIDPSWSSEMLKKLLEKHATVDIMRVDIVREYAFVFVANKEAGEKLIEKLNGADLEGHNLVVQISKNKQNLPDSDDLCFECGNSGHWAKRCPRRRARNNNNNNNNHTNHNNNNNSSHNNNNNHNNHQVNNNANKYHNNNNKGVSGAWDGGRNTMNQRKKDVYIGAYNVGYNGGGSYDYEVAQLEDPKMWAEYGPNGGAYISNDNGTQYVYPPALPNFTPAAAYDYQTYQFDPYTPGQAFFTTVLPPPSYVLSHGGGYF